MASTDIPTRGRLGSAIWQAVRGILFKISGEMPTPTCADIEISRRVVGIEETTTQSAVVLECWDVIRETTSRQVILDTANVVSLLPEGYICAVSRHVPVEDIQREVGVMSIIRDVILTVQERSVSIEVIE